MATITIQSETETATGWAYRVRVMDAAVAHRFEVTLSWSDHDLWSHGRLPPERVVMAVFRFLLDHEPVESILKRFDCSVVRRYFPQVDKELKNHL